MPLKAEIMDEYPDVHVGREISKHGHELTDIPAVIIFIIDSKLPDIGNRSRLNPAPVIRIKPGGI